MTTSDSIFAFSHSTVHFFSRISLKQSTSVLTRVFTNVKVKNKSKTLTKDGESGKLMLLKSKQRYSRRRLLIGS